MSTIAKVIILTTMIIVSMAIIGCSQTEIAKTEMLKQMAITQLDILDSQKAVFDTDFTSDGTGSIAINTPESTTVRIYEIDDIDIEDAKLIYRAMIRAEGFTGQAYLEMWCWFDGRGEFFSRDLSTPVTGPTDWTTEETFFFLKKGENPDRVRLNLVVNGQGTIWIDDIQLLKAPLKS